MLLQLNRLADRNGIAQPARASRFALGWDNPGGEFQPRGARGLGDFLLNIASCYGLRLIE